MIQVYDDLMFKPAWPILFAISRVMSRSARFSIGPGVVNPYHSHPSLIATNLASLNEESNGRAFLMLGKGAFHDLFRIKAEKPLTAIREAVEIIDGIVSSEPPELRGNVFSCKREAGLRWEVRHDVPRPRIWIGTWGLKTCELAAQMRQVSGVMVSSVTDLKYLKMMRDRIRVGVGAVGRSPSDIELGCVS